PALAPARPRGAGRRLADRVVHPAGAVLSFQAVQLLLWLDALPFRAVFLGNPDRSGSHHHGERRDGGVGVRSFRFDESRSDRGTRVDLVTGDAGNRSGRAGVDGGARPCTVSGRPAGGDPCRVRHGQRPDAWHGRVGRSSGGVPMMARWRARLRRWRAVWNRSEWMWRLLSLPPAPDDGRSGLILIQIDGFSHMELQRALKNRE